MRASLLVAMLFALAGCASRPGSSLGWYQRTNLREDDALSLLHRSRSLASLNAECRHDFTALQQDTN